MPPRSRNHFLSPALESIILKALDKNPARRYQSARELRVDLERLGDGVMPYAHAPRRWQLPAAIGAVVLVVAALFALNLGGARDRWLRRASPTAPASSIAPRRSLAVLGFRNLSGRPEEAWMSTALSEMLTTELAAGERLRTVPGEDVARMKLDLALSDADSFGRETLSRIRNHLGSDLVVLGSYLAVKDAEGRIRLDLRLQDTAAGETVAAASATGTEAELIDLITRVGAELRQKLAIEPASGSRALEVRASLPATPAGARFYAEGLAKLRLFEARQARELLEKAVEADPGYAPAHSALAAAWSALGYDANARAQARQAVDRSAGLSREERLSIEARYHELSRDWPKAIDSYRTLAGFFPDSLDYGLHLASVLVSAGRANEALTTIENLRQLPPPAGDDARIDLAETRAAAGLGDFKRDLDAAQRAAAKGQARGARLVVAQAKSAEGFALERLGRLDEAMAALAQAQELFIAGGDRLGAAGAVQMSGTVLLDKADYAGARRSYDAALFAFRQLGAQQRIAATLNNIGNVLYDQVQLEEAKKHYEEVLRIDREIGDRAGAAGALGNLANVLDTMGDLAGARTMQEQGLAAFREVGDRRGTASTLNNLGNVLMELGELAAARERYEESLAITRETGYKRGQAYSKFGLAEVLAAQGQLDPARAAAEEALALRTELRDENNAAWSRLQLASIAIAQRRAGDAEPLAREAVAAFERLKGVESGAVANAWLSAALLDQGKAADAAPAAERAVSLARSGASRGPRFDAAIARARVLGATGGAPDAVKELESTIAEAKKYGYLPYQLQARLALGRIAAASGDAAAAGQLAALERDAKAKGFALIGKQAAEARSLR